MDRNMLNYLSDEKKVKIRLRYIHMYLYICVCIYVHVDTTVIILSPRQNLSPRWCFYLVQSTSVTKFTRETACRHQT